LKEGKGGKRVAINADSFLTHETGGGEQVPTWNTTKEKTFKLEKPWDTVPGAGMRSPEVMEYISGYLSSRGTSKDSWRVLMNIIFC